MNLTYARFMSVSLTAWWLSKLLTDRKSRAGGCAAVHIAMLGGPVAGRSAHEFILSIFPLTGLSSRLSQDIVSIHRNSYFLPHEISRGKTSVHYKFPAET